MPPASLPASNALAVISAELFCVDPLIVLVRAAGRLTLAGIQRSHEFRSIVRTLGGKPYRVLCDFTQTVTMPEDVCAVFMRGQEFAIESGMERDAFVCTSSVLRLQFVRIARESGRMDRLGQVRFFETIEDARAYLEAPVSELPGAASSRRSLSLDPGEGASSRRQLMLGLGEGASSRRAPMIDLGGEAAPSRRHAPFDTSESIPSRRAPAVEIGEAAPSRRYAPFDTSESIPSRRPAAASQSEGPPSRRAAPFSLRAAVPSRPHNRG